MSQVLLFGKVINSLAKFCTLNFLCFHLLMYFIIDNIVEQKCETVEALVDTIV
jgi:hypothetical protein